ncbi:hypothetical protein DXD68_04095 [Parabacteroides sp. TM07-1AC]|uniref:hypothetical protein n=1 Tax=Parabacteroides sp. TM07-1AC TaxID=2292363 RepID=UPI000F00B885|nr:hypothetical protein [Parabacteroides sp. TM07-1AC]RHU30982.1 hypothetical protein DXD68_04095 [Parabacteroides sp. TM07-1AC]
MNDILENIDWFITLFTFIGGIYMYVSHTRRLNNQQKKLNAQQEQLNDQQTKLNEYQLQKSKEEELEKKQALIEAYVFKTMDRRGNSAWRMKIYNKGKAKASNINFESESLEMDNSINLLIADNTLPIPSLLPQGSVEFAVILCTGHKLSHRFKFTWEDESGIDRSQEQDVIFQ